MNDQDRRYKVLLIEDEETDRMAFQRFMRTNDLLCVADMATSVEEARRVLKEKVYDAVITDHDLGDGTAFEVIPLVKDTPVIFATGAGNEEIAAQALKAGASDYLVKDPEGRYLRLLMMTIVRAVGRRRSERQARMLFEAMKATSDAVWITSPEGEIIFANPAFSSLYGYDAGEALRLPAGAVWKEGSDAVEKGEVFHKKKNGAAFPADYSRTSLPGFIVHVSRDITAKRHAEQERELLISDLREALTQVKKLSGLLPICANCKQIRDDKHDWNPIETYIAKHSEANFTHGVCPSCVQKLYPEFAADLVPATGAAKP
jgi:PAS domain S-box-containing protein